MTILTDTISEYTPGAGVTLDGVLLKDNIVRATGGVVASTIKPAVDAVDAIKLSNAAGVSVLTIDTVNSVAYLTGKVSSAPLGSELLTNGTFVTADFTGWTAGAGWSAATGAAVHTAGIETLTQNVAVTSGAMYQLVFTTTGASAGSITITLGAVTLDVGGGTTAISTNSTQTLSIMAGATGTLAFTITPTNDYNGTIDTISLKLIGTASPVFALYDDAGFGIAAVYGQSSLYNIGVGSSSLSRNTTGAQNTGFGPSALAYNTTGKDNTALGYSALQVNTVGLYNTAVGRSALALNTTGKDNTAVGYLALRYNTTAIENTAIGSNALTATTTGSGNTAIGKQAAAANTTGYANVAVGMTALTANIGGANNSAFGYGALRANTSGLHNTALGMFSFYSQTTGSSNIAIGYYAARYHANGSTALTDPENSIYIGAMCRGFNNDDSNSIVIGYGAIGAGANTTVIGNTSTTLTALPGGALQISEMSAPTGVANKATVYARDNGSGKTMYCLKLGDDVEIVLATQA